MSHCTGGAKPHSPLRQSTIDYMQLAGLSQSTQRSYLRELDALSRHYRCPPDRLNERQLQDYVLARINAGLRPRSTNLTVAAMRMFYGRVLKRPQLLEHLVMRKVADRLPKVIDVDDLKNLVSATYDLRYRTAIRLAYSTGLRISEVVALTVGDIDSKKGFIHVGCGKGGHERLAFMPPALLEVLRHYYRQIHPKPVSWLFFGNSPEQQLRVVTLQWAFRQACERAGIGKDVTFHALRHSVATHLMERGASRDEVQDILGHRSAESTRVYARTTATMFRRLDHPAESLLN